MRSRWCSFIWETFGYGNNCFANDAWEEKWKGSRSKQEHHEIC